MNYKKVTFAQVKKEIKENGKFTGFFVGNKVNEQNYFDGWYLATKCEMNTIEDAELLKRRAEIMMDNELGNRVAWYMFI